MDNPNDLDLKNASAIIKRGSDFASKGKYRRAIEEFRKALSIDIDNSEALFELGSALVCIGDNSGAIAELKKAILLNPDDANVLCALGVASQRNGNIEDAISYFNVALLKKSQIAIYLHLNLGSAFTDKGDYDGAVAEFDKAIALNPDLHDAYFMYGITLEAKRDLIGAIDKYKKALEINPDFELAQLNLENILKQKNGIKTSHQDNGSVGNAKNVVSLDALTPYSKGRELFEIGDYEGAITEYQNAITIDPCFHLVYHDLGNAFYAKGNLDKANESFRKAIDAGFQQADTHLNLGIVLEEKGNLSNAIVEYNKALKINPNHLLAQIKLASALNSKDLRDRPPHVRKLIDDAIDRNSKGRYKSAIDLLTQAVLRDPENPYIHILLGVNYQAINESRKAIKELRKAIEIDQLDALAYFNLGVVFDDEGDLDSAISYYRKAIELEPDYVLAYYNLGVSLMDNGDLDEAISSFKHALNIDPNYGKARFNLGVANIAKNSSIKGHTKADQVGTSLQVSVKDIMLAISDEPLMLITTHYCLSMGLYEKSDILFSNINDGLYDKAICAYKMLLETTGDDSNIHNDYGVALSLKGNVDLAISEYNASLVLDGKNLKARCNLGAALAAKGNLRGAELMFLHALKINPEYSDAFCLLAVCCLKNNDLENAKKYTLDALRYSEPNEWSNTTALFLKSIFG